MTSTHINLQHTCALHDIEAAQASMPMLSPGPAYPAVFGLALEKRGAGKPNGNRTLDTIKNRRRALKNGRKVLAKPRPRGFYHDTEGMVLVKISGPADLQTSNRNIQKEEEALLEWQDVPLNFNGHEISLIPDFDVLNPPQNFTELAQNRNSILTARRRGAIHRGPRDSMEVMRRRGRVPISKRHTAVRLTVASDGGTTTMIVTPQGTRIPDSPMQSPPIDAMVAHENENKRASRVWTDNLSPDGTVRLSIVAQGTPTLPLRVITDSKNDFEEVLPRTIYMGRASYNCSEHEYFLPRNNDEANDQPQVVVQHSQDELDNARTLIARSYFHRSTSADCLGITLANISTRSIDVPVGIALGDIDTSYEDYRHDSITGAQPRATTYRPYRPAIGGPPSPPNSIVEADLATLIGPGAPDNGTFIPPPHARILPARSQVPTSWVTSYYTENGIDVGQAQAVPVRIVTASPVHIRDAPPQSPVDMAALHRAKIHLQRAAVENGLSEGKARRQAMVIGVEPER